MVEYGLVLSRNHPSRLLKTKWAVKLFIFLSSLQRVFNYNRIAKMANEPIRLCHTAEQAATALGG